MTLDEDNAAWTALVAAINSIEDESLRTCEACGAPGEFVTDNDWDRTLCAAHAAPQDAHPSAADPDAGNTD